MIGPAEETIASRVRAGRDMLLEQHVERCGWAYRRGGTPMAEPTAVSALAVLATDPGGSVEPAVREAADWLAGIQQADGSVGLSAQLATPGWSTPYALLLWSAVGSYSAERQKAVAWLLESSGLTRPPGGAGVIGHDRTIPGWPWVSGTCAWLEPTALAVLALGREGLTRHPRVEDGIRMIGDRAIASGGWNYGNPSMFNTPLRPQPAPTGLALLALTASGGAGRWVEDGCRYLRATLPRVRSPRSLGWGLLGLWAWQKRPAAADAWLDESFSRLESGPATALDLAQLLLAFSERSLEFFDVAAAERSHSP